MNQKEQYDCCAKQAELAFNSFNARREHQWKVTLGLWALLLLCTQFVIMRLPNPKICIVVPSALVIIIIHAAFVVGVWRKSAYDQKIFMFFRRKAAEILSGAKYDDSLLPTPLKFRDSLSFVRDGSSQFQITVTIILCIVCAIVVLTVKKC